MKLATTDSGGRTCPPCPGPCPACNSINAELMAEYQIKTMEFEKESKDSHNWITVDIRFKENTNEEFRENAVRGIEKIWIIWVKVLLREESLPEKNSANFYITVTKYPFSDTLKYRLSLFR